MAKKSRERKMSPALRDAFNGGHPAKYELDLNKLGEIADMMMENLSDEEKETFQLMLQLAMNGVIPEEYEQFYSLLRISNAILGNSQYGDDDSDEDSEDADDDFFFPFGQFGPRRGRYAVKEYTPLPDASSHTLVLKIKMKDVSKPPMWREVEIPADYDFMRLHEVIQAVVGLDDCHLWQFNVKAYDDSLMIGKSPDREDPFGMGVNDVSHEAETTPVTQFLQQKGDKLEYVYDFGDDWIFEVEVKELYDRKIDHPVCRKFKSELNAIEDFGGIWSYISTRESLEKWDKLSKKEKKECYENAGFETAEEYHEFLMQSLFDLEEVNDALKQI